MDDLFKQTEVVNSLLARYGVKFGIYKDGTFREQLFPFDPIPRVISKEEFDYLERGLRQRVDALNRFLADIYGEKRIIKDGVVPEEFVFTSSGFLKECDGIVPPKGIYSHISGIDLVEANVRAAMGDESLDVSFDGSDEAFATYVLHSRVDGTFHGVELSPEIAGHVYRCVMYADPGDPMSVFDGANKAIGILFMRFDDVAQMEEKLAQMGDLVTIY